MPNPYRATTAAELRALAAGVADAEERDLRGLPSYEWTAATPAELQASWLNACFDELERKYAEQLQQHRTLVRRYNNFRLATFLVVAGLFIIAVAGWTN